MPQNPKPPDLFGEMLDGAADLAEGLLFDDETPAATPTVTSNGNEPVKPTKPAADPTTLLRPAGTKPGKRGKPAAPPTPAADEPDDDEDEGNPPPAA